jgi:GWxTD domain-containing protein
LTIILISIIIFAFDNHLFSRNEYNLTATDYYEQGLTLAKQGEIQPAIKALEAAVEKDHKFAEAYHQLALLYMNLGTVESRVKATRALERALRLDSKNVQYQLSMAKLFLKKGIKGAAKRRFKKVLKLDPGNAEAYYHLGLLKEEDMLWYKDLISPQESTVFYFYEYANEDMKEAEKFFKKTIELDPNFATAYYHLALIQYELYDYKSMAEFLQKAINVQPDNKDFYLFLGLAFHKMGRYDSAYEYYNQAKIYMSNEERSLLESIEPLLDPTVKDQYAYLDNQEKSQFETIFWKQRDPLFITEFNERLLEHYSRFAYANMRFWKPGKDVEGWKTDQGQTYIRFGPPKFKYRTRPTVELTFKGNPLMPSQEFWSYQDFNLMFEDTYLSRNYSFKRSFYPDDDSKYVYDRLIKEIPDYYEPDFNGTKFEIPRVISQFMGESGKTKIQLYYGVPSDQVSLVSWGDSTKVLLKRGLFIFDNTWKDVSRKIDKRKLSLAGIIDKDEPLYMIDLQRLQLAPGAYHLALELADENSGNVGTYRAEITVRGFDRRQLEMSDLLLASDIQTNSSIPVYNIDHVNVIPSLFRTFTPSQPVFIYFEIYNLKLNEDNLSHYRVETTIRPMTDKKSPITRFASSLGKVFGFSNSKNSEVSTSYEYFGNSTMERIHHSVQISDAKSGKYMLIIRTEDFNSGKAVEKEVIFEIVDTN